MAGYDITSCKRDIRRSMLEKRNTISACELEQKSKAVCGRLIELPVFRDAGLVMAYMDFKNEVKTGDFIRECFKRGKRVALPVVLDAGRTSSMIGAFEIKDLVGCIRKGRFGIMEPDTASAPAVSETEIDMVVVPGVAFDFMGKRLGYGAGYYDCFLPKLRKGSVSVGIALELQVLDRLPCEEHDRGLDMIVTESRIIVPDEII